MKHILITGADGQDGRYMRELIDQTEPDAVVSFFTRSSWLTIYEMVRRAKFDECYHFAAFHRSSQAGTDRDAAESEKKYLADLNLTHDLLSALREHAPHCKVFLAGSCHQFGQQYDEHGTAIMPPLNERTPMRPDTMYGITKLAMMQMGNYFCGHHNLFVSTGILFNHESPLRGPSFITSRLARAAARGEKIEVGDLNAMVDWGFAGDYVKAMRLILEQEDPNIFVISSGELHTVREFAEEAYAHAGRNYKDFVSEAPMMHRPVSRGYFGDPSDIIRRGWTPTTEFSDLIKMMVDSHFGRTNGNSGSQN